MIYDKDYETKLLSILGQKVLDDAKAHARQAFPNESCGFVADGVYVACENKDEKPTEHFRIADQRYDAAVTSGKLSAIIHSHPHGPVTPSEDDMRQQIATNVPWVIIMLNEDDFGPVSMWGDTLPIAPIIGRPFAHGIYDCYAAFRDVFRTGREALKEQGIGWPFDPIVLPQVPRDDKWWEKGEDLYMDHLKEFGFSVIQRSEAKPGDAFLMKIGNREANPLNRINHGGVLVDGDRILHHVPNRPSRREPAGVWAYAADLWIRHEAQK